jgi:hypothetical protein
VSNEDAQYFLNLGGIVGAGVVEEGIAVVFCIVAEVVGVFLKMSTKASSTGVYNLLVQCSRHALKGPYYDKAA